MKQIPTNLEIAALLKKIAASYTILDENRFKIIAYERAADSIEHLTGEAKDLWDVGKLARVSGIGPTIAGHLAELFSKGKVKHFEQVFQKIPAAIFPLLQVPGLGPKKAYKLVTALGIKSEKNAVPELLKAAKAGKIKSLPTFGEKSEADIVAAIQLFQKGSVKENRMVLSEADGIAQEILAFLKKSPKILQANVLGSLRRQVSTIGDIDIAVSTRDPEIVIDQFLAYPHQKLIERGPKGASFILHNGRQVDLRVSEPETYGSMLQYFTGSKNHNIRLRTLALEQGLSLSEYGIKALKGGKVRQYQTEESFYQALSLPWVPPELREDSGEIEAAQKNQLPKLVQLADIRGDLHIHTDYDLEPSHDLGQDSLETYLNLAENKSYEYLGINDHNPSVSNHSDKQIVDIMKKRKDYYEKIIYSSNKKNKKNVRVFIMCEVDITPDGALALPEEALAYVDGVIVSVHSSFQMEPALLTNRVIQALNAHPKVRILGHPTGRLLGRREGMDLNFQDIFRVIKNNNQAIEINCHPLRLDLPDFLVRDAVKAGVRLVLGTDSHEKSGLANMKYGLAVARRGWANKSDIVNTMPYNEFNQWLTGSG